MHTTVSSFILDMLERTKSNYERHTGWVAQFFHRTSDRFSVRFLSRPPLHHVYLAKELFERLVGEGKPVRNDNSILLEDVVVHEGSHPTLKGDFVVDFQGRYPESRNTHHYGLQ